jgi:hypothetical protein
MTPMKKSTNHRLAQAVALTIAASAVFTSGAQANYLKVGGFNLAAGGTFNMSESTDTVANAALNGLIIQAADAGAQATNITNVYNALTTGFNAGDWLGTGVTSPTVAADAAVNGVLGVMLYDNTQLGFANFAGATNLDTVPDTDLNQVMTRITYSGDYDASGNIDSGDYGLLDYYFSQALTPQGDINFDNVVDSGDYGLLDYTFSTQAYGDLTNVTALSGSLKSAVVPEPMSFALLLSGVACVLSLRKRH